MRKMVAAVFLVGILGPGLAWSQDKAAFKAAEAACEIRNPHLKLHVIFGDGSVQQPPKGRALVYLVQDQSEDLTIGISLDGKQAGELQNRSHFAVAVDPGNRQFCGKIENRGWGQANRFIVDLKAEPDHVYFVSVWLRIDYGSDGPAPADSWVGMRQVNDDEGRLLVASTAESFMRRGR